MSPDNVRSIHLSQEPLGRETRCYRQRVRTVREIRNLAMRYWEGSGSVILHGSYATGEITEFSDIDLLILTSVHSDQLTSRNRAELREAKSALERAVHKIDPLMHHGVDVIFGEALHRYDESVLPLDSLRKSVLVAGRSSWTITPDREISISNAKRKLRRICNEVLSSTSGIVDRTPYKTKCLLSVVFLVPALLLQSDRGKFLYKRESIEVARDLYGKKIAFDLFDEISRVREDWRLSRFSIWTRRAVAFLEREPIPPLALQRISGALPITEKNRHKRLLGKCQKFVSEVMQYVDGN